jgi:hypothetical protein
VTFFERLKSIKSLDFWFKHIKFEVMFDWALTQIFFFFEFLPQKVDHSKNEIAPRKRNILRWFDLSMVSLKQQHPLKCNQVNG